MRTVGMMLIPGKLYRTKVSLYWVYPNAEIKLIPTQIMGKGVVVLCIRDNSESFRVIYNDGIVEVPMGTAYENEYLEKRSVRAQLIAAQFFEEVET